MDEQCEKHEGRKASCKASRRVRPEWSGAQTPYPRECSIGRLFAEVVAQRAQSDAVLSCGVTLSYKELNSRANRLAHRLRKAGVGLETPVGIGLNRSVEMIAAILAVLKAGAKYVPLDSYLSAPPDRVDDSR